MKKAYMIELLDANKTIVESGSDETVAFQWMKANLSIEWDDIQALAHAFGFHIQIPKLACSIKSWLESETEKAHAIQAEVWGKTLRLRVWWQENSDPSNYTITGNFIVHWD